MTRRLINHWTGGGWAIYSDKVSHYQVELFSQTTFLKDIVFFSLKFSEKLSANRTMIDPFDCFCWTNYRYYRGSNFEMILFFNRFLSSISKVKGLIDNNRSLITLRKPDLFLYWCVMLLLCLHWKFSQTYCFSQTENSHEGNHLAPFATTFFSKCNSSVRNFTSYFSSHHPVKNSLVERFPTNGNRKLLSGYCRTQIGKKVLRYLICILHCTQCPNSSTTSRKALSSVFYLSQIANET